jgi:dolichol-phosphate mannosyltransferase
MTYRAARLGFEIAEVPIVFRDRRAGSSKMDGAIVTEAAWRVPLMRFSGRRPAKPAPPPDTPDGRRYTF